MTYAIQIKASGTFLGNDGNTYVEDVYDAFVSDSKTEIDHFFAINECKEDYCEIVEAYNN